MPLAEPCTLRANYFTTQDLRNCAVTYEEAADSFMSTRNPHIGVATVRKWSQTFAASSSILDLGCGHGMAISQVLVEEGFTVYGIDASTKLISRISQTVS